MSADVTLLGEVHCSKARLYPAALQERGITHDKAEVDKDPKAMAGTWTRRMHLSAMLSKVPIWCLGTSKSLFAERRRS